MLERLAALLTSPDLVHEAVAVSLTTGPTPLGLGTVVAAAGWGAPVRLQLSVHRTAARLTGVELLRVAGGAPLPTSLAVGLWAALDPTHVTRLRVGDAGAVAALADARVLGRYSALRVLNLSHAGLGALPPAVGRLAGLQVSGVGGGHGLGWAWKGSTALLSSTHWQVQLVRCVPQCCCPRPPARRPRRSCAWWATS